MRAIVFALQIVEMADALDGNLGNEATSMAHSEEANTDAEQTTKVKQSHGSLMVSR